MRWPHLPIVYLLTELILGYLLYWFLGFNPVLLIVITALLLLFWIGSLFMGQLSQDIRSMGFYSKYFRRARLEKKPLPLVLLLDRLRIAVCHDEHAFALADFRPTHLLVAENPKINFDRLLDSLRQQQVVFGGDNRPRRVAQWKISCQKHGIPYYNLSEQGSLKITP